MIPRSAPAQRSAATGRWGDHGDHLGAAGGWPPEADGPGGRLCRVDTHGATSHRVFQDGDTVVVVVDFPDDASVASFRADPALAEAMKEAGVISVPEVDVLTEVDARSY